MLSGSSNNSTFHVRSVAPHNTITRCSLGEQNDRHSQLEQHTAETLGIRGTRRSPKGEGGSRPVGVGSRS
jgi:hypothetical protein